MVADCESRFLSLAAELSAALPCALARTSARATSSPKTRVGDSRHRASGRLSRRGRFRSMFTPGSRACAYRTASGRRKWVSGDPLGEPGFEILRHGKANLLGDGPNLYTFVRNDSIDRTDYLGLAISSIDASVEACMKLPTPALQQACLNDLFDTLGMDKQCAALAAAVQIAKGVAGAMGACKSRDSCAILRAKSLAWISLAIARSRLHKKCFCGGDATHQAKLAEHWKTIGECTRYQVQNGCVGPL